MQQQQQQREDEDEEDTRHDQDHEKDRPQHFQPLHRNHSFPGALACVTNSTTMASNNFITHLTGDGSESRIIEDEIDDDDDDDDKTSDHGGNCVLPPKLPRPSPGIHCRTSSAPLFEKDSQNYCGSGQAQLPVLVPRESLKRKVIRRTLFAICIFFGQSFLSAALKRYGIIEKDMNQVMAERFAPAQQALAEYLPDIHGLEIKIQETIENARLMAPGFNDTMYWLRLNNQLLQLQKEEDGGTDTKKTAASTTSTTGRLRPGQRLARRMAEDEEQRQQLGLNPVVMIPGFVTSGLEVWKGKDCMESGFFRGTLH